MNIFKTLNIKTIKGRITVIVLFLVFGFTSFSVYILYENYIIKNKFYSLNTHAEPNITLTFVAQFNLGQTVYYVSKASILRDTTGITKGFAQSVNGIQNVVKIIKLHCDTLGLDYYAPLYDSILVSLDNYRNVSNKYFDIISKGEDYYMQNRESASLSFDEYLSQYHSNQFDKAYWDIYNKIFSGLRKYIEHKDNSVKYLRLHTERIVYVIFFVLIALLIFSFFMWRSIYNYLNHSINRIVQLIKRISSGELIKEQILRRDEVGEVIEATNQLSDNLKNAGEFASHIGKGDFSYDFHPVSDKDSLGHSLVTMRDELQKFKLEDEKRFWINQGFAKFGEIFRNNNTNLSQLSDIFISELVKYVKANQGSLFVANTGKDGSLYLEMTACYAYSRKKFINSQLEPGEGLVGQVFLEKDYIYITEVPEDYVKITSGLGEALPRAVLLMPLVIDDKSMGVIELASFHPFEDYQIDFIKKLGEDLASVLQSVRTNEHTHVLVQQLQERTEQMHSQEEEIRQNMEELMATQEEVMRKEQDYIKTIKELREENERLKKLQVQSILN